MKWAASPNGQLVNSQPTAKRDLYPHSSPMLNSVVTNARQARPLNEKPPMPYGATENDYWINELMSPDGYWAKRSTFGASSITKQ